MRAGADGWLRCEIDRGVLRSLQERSDTKGLINLLLFLGPLAVVGYLAYTSIGTWLAVPLFWVYGSIYGFSISLLHETHHGTPFRSRVINTTAHMLAGFMTLRNPVYDRCIHLQHHRSTSMSGDDPELAHAKPIAVWRVILDLFWLRAAINLPLLLATQLLGAYSNQERRAIPEKLLGRIRVAALSIVAFYAVLLAISISYQTWLPLLYTYLAHIYGGFVPRLYALTQHLGLAQDKRDFRLNSRTCIYNPIVAAWYWNMNYHIEHHMFPLVPFHALPLLHGVIKSQMPAANTGVLDAWREILKCVRQQSKTPGYAIEKILPKTARLAGLKAFPAERD